MLNHLAADVIVMGEEPSLAEQLANHIMELNTMKEADLCNSRAMTERVFDMMFGGYELVEALQLVHHRRRLALS